MGIFNIKSLKDKYTWGSSENKTNSAETTEAQPATAVSSANIADGVRSLIKNNPDLAGKNRRGVVGRAMRQEGSLLKVVDGYETVPQEAIPEEELSADGTATVSAQPLTHTDIEATPGDILEVQQKPTGPSIIRVGQHNAPRVDAEELANPEEANPQNGRNTRPSPTSKTQAKTQSERTPLFKLSPKTLNRAENTHNEGPFEALFVCTGNIARSASGEVIAKHLAAEYGLEDKWIFASAGTGALVGHGVYEHVANELIERGYNPEGFASRQLNGQIVENATIILVAEKVHADWIVREWPQYHSKIKLLKQVARIRKDARRAEPISYLYSHGARPLDSDKLEDPYRRGPAAAKVAVDEVEQSLRIILPWLAQAHR